MGKALDVAGKAVKGTAEALLFFKTGQPALAAQQIAATASEISPALREQLEKREIDTSDPYEDTRQVLPTGERIASGLGPGLLQMTPQLALAALQPELGPALFGFTPNGIDLAQGTLAMIAPGGGKMLRGVAEKLAAKTGISSEAVLNAVNRIGGSAGVASILSTPGVYQIAQMKPGSERDKSIQNVAANAIFDGHFGERWRARCREAERRGGGEWT